MLAVNYSTIRSNLKEYCDMVTDENETVIVTRKGKKNVVVLSLEEYNELNKVRRNKDYLAMLDESRRQLSEGKTYTFTMDELGSMENMSAAEMQAFAEAHKDF